MIIHTSKSLQIPSQNETKLKLQIQNQSFEILQETLHATHLLKLLDKIVNIKWIEPELKALQRGHGMRGGRTDVRTDRRADGVKPIYTQQLRCAGGIIIGCDYLR